MTLLDSLLLKTTEFFRGDARRIQHFLKVYAYAALIGRLEGLDGETQAVLEAAAVVHDVGIKPAEERFGYNTGKLQEELGPAEAEKIMRAAGYAAPQIERACSLVGRHHTCSGIDGADCQILIEADFLVNLQEEGSGEDAVRAAYERIFRTESGKLLCQNLFDIAP